MWGVSIQDPVGAAGHRPFAEVEELRRLALDELDGVGDPGLGEWVRVIDLGDFGPSVQVRRRLTAEEEKLAGPVIDIRGTAEAAERLWKVAKLLPVADREAVLHADD